MANIDLIAINIDEAAAVAGTGPGKAENESIVISAVQKLRMSNEHIMVSVTAGRQGSWCWDTRRMNRFPAVATETISTAGAGDAFFAGILCAIALGLTLNEAQQLATLVAGLSVTSPHTINSGVDRHSLYEFQHVSGLEFSETINKLLED
jgi:sugar/nucleoside kinase (ribokinase family)